LHHFLTGRFDVLACVCRRWSLPHFDQKMRPAVLKWSTPVGIGCDQQQHLNVPACEWDFRVEMRHRCRRLIRSTCGLVGHPFIRVTACCCSWHHLYWVFVASSACASPGTLLQRRPNLGWLNAWHQFWTYVRHVESATEYKKSMLTDFSRPHAILDVIFSWLINLFIIIPLCVFIYFNQWTRHFNSISAPLNNSEIQEAERVNDDAGSDGGGYINAKCHCSVYTLPASDLPHHLPVDLEMLVNHSNPPLSLHNSSIFVFFPLGYNFPNLTCRQNSFGYIEWVYSTENYWVG